MEHLEANDLLAFYSRPSRELHARGAGHLLSGCVDCLSKAMGVLRSLGFDHKGPSCQDLAVAVRESALIRQERSRATVAWARVADMDEGTRVDALQARRGLRNYGLALYVLDEAESFVARRKTAKAADMVRFSAAVSGNLSPRIYGVAPLADLKLRQESMLCNIRRHELDFHGALGALTNAGKFKDRGVDPGERARFCRIKASLLNDLGEFDEAARAASEAVSLYGAMLDRNSKAKALLQQALIVSLLDPRVALQHAEEGLNLFEGPESKPLLSGI